MADKGFVPVPLHKERQLDYVLKYRSFHQNISIAMMVRNRFKWRAWLKARTIP